MMDGKAVADAIAQFNGQIDSNGTILGSIEEDSKLPKKYQEMLSSKSKPDNWHSGNTRPAVHKE